MSESSEIMRKLDSMEQKMDSMEQKMDSMEQRMDFMEQKMDSMEQRMDFMEQKMDSMDKKIDELDGKIEKVRTDLEERIEMTEYALRRESESIYQVVCDNHRALIAQFVNMNEESQKNQVILKSHTKKFNNLKQALN